MMASQSAHATTIVVDFSANPFSTVPFTLDGVYINVLTGATGTTGSSTTGWDLNPYFTGSTAPPAGFRFFTPTGGGMVGAAGIVSPLAGGTTIGAASSFITGALNATAAAPTTSYFGFRFLNETTAVTNYGYVIVQQLAVPPVAGAVKILGYAYENAGLSITTPVPEPSTALMMVGGLLAAASLRKRLMSRRDQA